MVRRGRGEMGRVRGVVRRGRGEVGRVRGGVRREFKRG